MTTTYLLYDARSGTILSAHHGAADEKEVRKALQSRAKHPGQSGVRIGDEHVAVIAVPSGSVEPGKRYKVDVNRKVLVPTEGKEGGVGFGAGPTGRSI